MDWADVLDACHLLPCVVFLKHKIQSNFRRTGPGFVFFMYFRDLMQKILCLVMSAEKFHVFGWIKRSSLVPKTQVLVVGQNIQQKFVREKITFAMCYFYNFAITPSGPRNISATMRTRIDLK
ncbi:hypothetical protein CEXT_84401 [Caerostris extrusa]|uniref:Uncharacterized protein n=1 Tax=Caerostris extrusa TaxID=172846 RepID=A0AAV4UX21_CAEEX|nr:hypothetical protein CEXT_84401 [Caerostris extrusa]